MSIKSGLILPGERHKSTQQQRQSEQNVSRSHTISKDDIERFRNSNKHNICVEMLWKGYHRSFSEMFSLLQQQNSSRSAGPGSASLDSQLDKMNTLKHHLTRAEEAERRGSWSSVYDHQVGLAEFFSSPEDFWLKDHFYLRSFQTSSKIQDQQIQAAACANMANVYVEQGRWGEASQMIDRLSLVKGRGSEVGVSLWKLHCRLAESAVASGDLPLGLDQLHKAYDISTQAGDAIMLGDSAYRLGSTYQAAGDLVTAQKFLNIYADISSSLGDAHGLGKAYKSLSMCMESEGRLDETLQYLEKFVAVSKSNRTLGGAVSPSNQDAVSPSNQDAVSSSNQDAVSSSNQDAVSPSNQDAVSPSNQDAVSPSNQDAVSPSNQDAVSPSNQDAVSPSNQDAVSPSNQDAVSPSNQDAVSSSNQDAVSPSNQDAVSPSNQDAVSPSNQPYSHQDACMCLGQLYYRKGQYGQSCQYFQQGYSIACDLGQMDLVEKAQVFLGSAHAHGLTQSYNTDLQEDTAVSLQRLLSWKQRRDAPSL